MARKNDKDWLYSFERPYSWGTLDERWYYQYLELKKYQQIHGDCKVPKAWKPNPSLARWVSSQRRKKEQMPSWRKELLDQLDFTWRINPPLSVPPKSWEQHYQALKAFKKRYDHANVPDDWPENRRLAKWVKAQRGDYKKELLSAEKVKKLEAIGFTWVLQEQLVLPWIHYYRKLQEFKQVHGHCNVPSTFEDKKLARWVSRQRKIVDTISEERKECLNQLGFCWRLLAKRHSWQERFQQLMIFKAQHGHCNVSNIHKNNVKHPGLRSWIQEQRRKYKAGTLSETQITQLEGIGFVWSFLEDAWIKTYQQLVTFKEQNGHCQPSATNPATKRLGLWVRTQRQAKSTLSQARFELLESIGFEWQPMSGKGPAKKASWQIKSAEIWQVKFEQLKAYHQQHGHCRVSGENPLSRWIRKQRYYSKNNMLSKERIDLLNSLNFVWLKAKKKNN